MGKHRDFVKATLSLLRSFIIQCFLLVILGGLSFVILSPLIDIVSKTFMSSTDVRNPLVYVIPINFTLENLSTAFTKMDYVASLGFTILFCTAITLLQVFVSSLTGYGFARFRFFGRNILFAIVILTIVIPPQTIMIPMYTQFRYFDVFGLYSLLTGEPGKNLVNTLAPITMLSLTGVGLRSGLYIYIFRQFFKGLPKEIEEAAFIDGASAFSTYYRIMLPNAVSSIVTVAMFSMVWQYNDTYYVSLFMPRMNFLATNVATVGAIDLNNVLAVPDPAVTNLVISAGIFLCIIPIVILYLVLQKSFTEGIERSGIVG